MREIRDFERENISMSRHILDSTNISMSRPTLYSTPNIFNTNNRTKSSIESIQIRTNTPEPTLLTQPMEFPEQNRNAHVPDEPDPDPSFSELLLKKKKRNKKKKNKNTRKMTRQTHLRATIMICPATVITDASEVRGETIGKRTR